MSRRSPPTASIHDVARRAGVSIASVSRVLNGRSGGVSDDIRQRVGLAVTELDYRPNRIGRALRRPANDTCALIISNIQNNFYAAVAWEMERLLNERGHAMLLFNSNEDAQIQDRCLEEIQARQIGGVFLLCPVESPRLHDMVAREPVVFVNRRIVSLPDVSFVGIDDRAAARELMATVMRTSGGPIAIVHGPLASDTSARRFDGFLRTAEEHGRPVAERHVRGASLSMESGYAAARSLLAQATYPAIVCGNDQIAYGVYRRCRELGLSVPDDVRILGFDDNPLNEWLAPWLDTVRVPHLAFASAALERMDALRVGADHATTILPYDLVLRSGIVMG